MHIHDCTCITACGQSITACSMSLLLATFCGKCAYNLLHIKTILKRLITRQLNYISIATNKCSHMTHSQIFRDFTEFLTAICDIISTPPFTNEVIYALRISLLQKGNYNVTVDV